MKYFNFVVLFDSPNYLQLSVVVILVILVICFVTAFDQLLSVACCHIDDDGVYNMTGGADNL